MQYRRWLAPVVICLLAPYALAQLRGKSGGAPSGTGTVHIHVVYADDRSASSHLLVCLMQGSTSTSVAMSYTNDGGKADFPNIPVGDYHVVVSGDGIQTTESATFEVDSRRVTQAQYVTVRQTDAAASESDKSKSGAVSALDLNVPPKARKELDDAYKAAARQDWKKAGELLNQAVTLYPQYVGAYNALGVVYSKMNDSAHAKEALEKALSLDEHFAPACENLAKLYLKQKDFPHAETFLGKALSVDPNNGQDLTLLADTQYMEHRYDAAIATAQRAHTLPNQHPSSVHYIAAKAYQQESRQAEALAEFQMFLKEEPTGPRADHVRSDMAKMQASAQ